MAENKVGVWFAPDVQQDFFGELIRIAAGLDKTGCYAVMARLFRLAVDQCVAMSRIHFTGLFSKVDYLIKEREIALPLARDIHDTRHRLRQYQTLEKAELEHCFPYDLKAVCLFISAIYEQAPIPKELSERFPVDEMPRMKRRLAAGRLRVIVQRWDDRFLYVTSEETGETLTVCYQSDDVYQSGDWSYLRDLLREGVQMNLIKPRLEQGVYYPELFVYEPDFLVDISSVAACFESYATSPLIHLLNKIKPVTSTEPILLGNFAGQLLDECVHHKEQSYGESIRSFFQQHALDMAACTQLDGSFHVEAQAQQQHIRQVLDQVLTVDVKSYRREELLVEPSFFCEMLGIQGRMDLLQQDYNLLVEQKSGKGGFPPHPDPQVPRHQVKHYVQLLLYMALLHYQYGKSYNAIYPFLLYSKYEKGLLQVGPAPKLLFEAMRVRNGIAYGELSGTEHGFRILEQLTPDQLCQHGASGPLWSRYIRPQLVELLMPIRMASVLERAYYFRFLTFIETEHVLSKMGNKTKENGGFASIWNHTLEEKIQAGDIYYGLTLDVPPVSSEVRDLTLHVPEDQGMDQTNFRVGDIVVLYAYPEGEEPQADKTMVFRASLVELSDERIVVRLRNPQTDRRVFIRQEHERWALEHDFLDSSYSALYRGMHTFLLASSSRKALLLNIRVPRIDTQKHLLGAYGELNELVLRAKQAEECFLVIGPPGTGKTSFALLNILQEALLEPASSVLLMSYTNRAVDEICSKLVEQGIDFIRLGSELSCAKAYHEHLLKNRVSGCNKVAEVRTLIQQTRVMCGTTSSLNANRPLLSMKHFTLAIIDEASQILEPHIVGLLSARCGEQEAIDKFVLIGDHKQLPAVVQQTEEESRVRETELQAIGLEDCRLSLFERLLKKYRHNPALVYQLSKQGRMHPDIAAFPNRYFYQEQLQVVPLAHQREQLHIQDPWDRSLSAMLATHRLLFVSAPLPGDTLSDKVNPVEANIIAAVVEQTYRMWQTDFDIERSIGVIVPYRNQIATIRQAIAKMGVPGLERIAIDTVERYQGSQRDLIIYGFTIQKRYQLNFLCSHVFEEEGDFIDRKLNVVMTRARKRLVLVGHTPLLAESGIFARLIHFIRERGGLLTIDEER
ncbi:MAG: ATP-dependent helicase [Parabacteroides sp.]